MIDQYFAHTLPGKPPTDWQPLEEHLKETAEKAKAFASAFGVGDWGYLAGLWHDLQLHSKSIRAIHQIICRRAVSLKNNFKRRK